MHGRAEDPTIAIHGRYCTEPYKGATEQTAGRFVGNESGGSRVSGGTPSANP